MPPILSITTRGLNARATIMIIRNLSGIFTGEGFVQREGRRVRDDDCSFVAGPIDIAIDDRGTISGVGRELASPGEVIDGAGMIALPGFIDPHTHAIFSGDRSTEYFMRWAGKTYLEISQAGGGIHSTVTATAGQTSEELEALLRLRLQNMLACGATVVEVKSGYAATAEDELRLLRCIKRVSEDRAMPELRPSFLGLHALPRGRIESEFVDEMIAALPEVTRHELATQVDSFPEKGFFTRESALRFSAAAKASGLPCKVHADELCDLGSSAAFIRAGALSIDHLQHINNEAVSLLATHPTVATMLPATSFFVGIPYANARRLLDAGARVALATDFNPGTAPAFDLQLTHMLAASQMKMTPAEILCASTYNAAAALGLEKTHGAIMPGRVGNILLYSSTGAAAGLTMLQQISISRAKPFAVVLLGSVSEQPRHG
ncbi:MAG TPA: imidazolonepropionase [Tepidisphaeraceae bacterium]|nr:imidazolonepropionase [Tepidisphaeraceae bacterium]